MNNKDSVAAGFAWKSPKSVTTGDRWLRDLVLALIVVLAPSFLFMIGDGYSNPRPAQKITSIGSPPHNAIAIQAAALLN